MIPATHSAHSIETTAESLRDELARLEIQKQALERELAAVVAHLDSVQQTLGALHGLMADARATPAGGASDGDATEQVDAADPAVSRQRPVPARPTVSAPPPPSSSPTSAALPRQAKTGAKDVRKEPVPASASASGHAEGHSAYGKITDQILEYFAGIGGVEVRARDVAAALGRDSGNGSINAVRSTLDRLVGASRLQRAGRGLYRAQNS
ncbi:hypothetical protein [Actinacidiphila acidipaludis]|uniref:Uncharacterized protein n=1 Tax=Actinacidiphila acidipaludis TaxID=2873382 RepID=A0ABS7Q0W8_9ACTN|nr:hypothetical protein [Streptomyces acidipaludis]MBY8876090.1 hypothetical protein [Streptomyces acidipaludis]